MDSFSDYDIIASVDMSFGYNVSSMYVFIYNF